MKKFIKVLLWIIFVLILIVLIGGFIFIKTFDLNKYKPYVQKVVYEQTGRELSLNGDASLKFSLIPTVKLNDVALSNVSWSPEKQMISAESVEVSVALMPLLHQEIVIDQVNLIDPKVFLSVNAQGEPNWIFQKPVPAKEKTDTQARYEFSLIGTAHAADPENISESLPAENTSGMSLRGILARHLTIENGLVVYQDLKNGQKHEVIVKNFDLLSENMDSNVNIAFEALYNNNAVSGTMTTGSINALVQNRPDFPLKADLKAYGANLKADMILNNIFENPVFSGEIKALNPSGNLGLFKIDVSGNISGTKEKIRLTLSPLNVAGNIFNTDLDIDLKNAVPSISGKINTDGFDLRTLQNNAKTASFSLIFEAHAADFVPNSPLDLSFLKLFNANIALALNNVLIDENIGKLNLHGTAKVQNGTLTLSPLEIQNMSNKLTGSVSAVSGTNAVSVNLSGSDISLTTLFPFLKEEQGKFGFVNDGKSTLDINLTGQGATLRQLVQSLRGQTVFINADSTLKFGTLKYLSGNFVSQLLSSLNLKKQNKDMKLTCAVVRGDFKDGKITFPKGIVFNSKSLVIVSDGTLNLQNDKLDFSLHPFNGQLTDTNVGQAISSLIKIGGTVQNPKIGIDNASVVKNVVGFAAGGPAFLGSQLLFDADDSPCYTALKGTAYQNVFPAPKGVKAASQGIYQGAGDLVNDSVNMITDTAKDVLKIFKKK